MAMAGTVGAANVWKLVGWVILGVTAVVVVAVIVDEGVKYSKEKMRVPL